MTRNAPVRALGTALHTTSTTNALYAARLMDWNVRKEPMFISRGRGTTPDLEVPGKYAVVRGGPTAPDVMAVVGERYHVVQNEEHAAFLDAVVHQSGGEYEAATALRGGRLVYLSIKLPDTIRVGGSDRVDQYITAVNSHDGTTPFMLSFGPVRVACANMLPLLRKRSQFKVKHTQSLTGRVQEAREALQVMLTSGESLAEEAERLANHRMTPTMYRNTLSKLFPRPSQESKGKVKSNGGQEQVDHQFAIRQTRGAPGPADAAGALADAAARVLAGDADAEPGKRSLNSWEMQRANLELALHSDANAPIADTLWGGLNAIVEYMDHFRPVAGDADQVRAEQALLSAPIIKKKEEARNYFLNLAGL